MNDEDHYSELRAGVARLAAGAAELETLVRRDAELEQGHCDYLAKVRCRTGGHDSYTPERTRDARDGRADALRLAGRG